MLDEPETHAQSSAIRNSLTRVFAGGAGGAASQRLPSVHPRARPTWLDPDVGEARPTNTSAPVVLAKAPELRHNPN